MHAKGTIHGNNILLESPLPGLEGKKVSLQLEVIDEPDLRLSPQEQRDAWGAWLKEGPQGPFDVEEGSDWP